MNFRTDMDRTFTYKSTVTNLYYILSIRDIEAVSNFTAFDVLTVVFMKYNFM
jgi:hypothetical protein